MCAPIRNTSPSLNRISAELLHRKEIDRLIGKSQEDGKTLIPLKLYSKNGIVKLQIAVAGRKKQYDKRREIAKKTANREIERAMKERLRR